MKSKLKIIIPIGIALIAIALAFVFIRFAPAKTTDIGTMISTAQQYLTEQKYEQAIAEFQKIIEIDPKNADAYIGLAKAYIGIGDTDKAIEVLEDGYEQTNDDRILEMLEELKSGMETAETTVTTVETTETAAETTAEVTDTEIAETETTEDAEIEQVRQQALDILSPYAPNKPKGEPNSTFYAYFNGFYHDCYDCFKCEYDEKGVLKNVYFTEIFLGNIDSGDITTYNPYSHKEFELLHNGNFTVFEDSYTSSGYIMKEYGWWYQMMFTDLVRISENEYTDEFNQIAIHLENNVITKIEEYGIFNLTLTYNSELSTWESNVNYISPYIIGLPDGYDDSIFGFDESKVEKTFTDYDEFKDYTSNN